MTIRQLSISALLLATASRAHAYEAEGARLGNSAAITCPQNPPSVLGLAALYDPTTGITEAAGARTLDFRDLNVGQQPAEVRRTPPARHKFFMFNPKAGSPLACVDATTKFFKIVEYQNATTPIGAEGNRDICGTRTYNAAILVAGVGNPGLGQSWASAPLDIFEAWLNFEYARRPFGISQQPWGLVGDGRVGLPFEYLNVIDNANDGFIQGAAGAPESLRAIRDTMLAMEAAYISGVRKLVIVTHSNGVVTANLAYRLFMSDLHGLRNNGNPVASLVPRITSIRNGTGGDPGMDVLFVHFQPAVNSANNLFTFDVAQADLNRDGYWYHLGNNWGVRPSWEFMYQASDGATWGMPGGGSVGPIPAWLTALTSRNILGIRATAGWVNQLNRDLMRTGGQPRARIWAARRGLMFNRARTNLNPYWFEGGPNRSDGEYTHNWRKSMRSYSHAMHFDTRAIRSVGPGSAGPHATRPESGTYQAVIEPIIPNAIVLQFQYGPATDFDRGETDVFNVIPHSWGLNGSYTNGPFLESGRPTIRAQQ